MAEKATPNNTAVKILAAILVSVILSFLAGRYTGPAYENQKLLAEHETRLRVLEVTLPMIQTDVRWIRDALGNQGITP